MPKRQNDFKVSNLRGLSFIHKYICNFPIKLLVAKQKKAIALHPHLPVSVSLIWLNDHIVHCLQSSWLKIELGKAFNQKGMEERVV